MDHRLHSHFILSLIGSSMLISLVSGGHHFTPEYDYQNGEIVGEMGSGESEFSEPAALVYDVMSKKLSKMEKRLQTLESGQCDCNKFYTAGEVEQLTRETRAQILDTVNQRLLRTVSKIENRTQEVIQEALSRPANTSTAPSPTHRNRTSIEIGDNGQGHHSNQSPSPAPEDMVLNDCNHVAMMGGTGGTYHLNIAGLMFDGYCDIDSFSGEAWLVIQRRVNGDIDFFRNWTEYSEGFGELEGDFWIGNEMLHTITSTVNHMLRVEMEDEQGATAYSDFNKFKVGAEEDDYKLSYTEFDGTAGDSLISANGQAFSTYDSDHDNSILYNCARLHKGAFWYDKCGSANLNGVLRADSDTPIYRWQSVTWYSWYGDLRPLKTVKMKIRPVEY